MDASLDPVDVAFAGVVGQRELLRAGRVTAVELLELSLSRIERFESRLNCFRTLFPESARAEAEAADAATDDRPLLGVPVAVKDNVPVAGSSPFFGTGSPEAVGTRDAELVRRLRAAGAVVVGATNLPELALWPFTESPTWGITRNPWDPSRTPGGSSGGSAAAVAAGLVAAGHASDGGGSIRIPAACCGLVGLKPTAGRVPLSPDLEHWHGMSSHGVVTRSVADTAAVLGVLLDEPLDLTPPGPLRIAWSTRPVTPAPVDQLVKDAVARTADRLRGLGHEVVAGDPSYAGVQESFLVRYLRGVRDDHVRLVDPSRTEPRTRAVAALGGRVGDRALSRARRLGAQFASRPFPGGADVVLTPTMGGPPHPVSSLTGRRTIALAGRRVPFTPPWNVGGHPAISIPAGTTPDGMPLAVQLVAAHGRDDLLLALAAQLEDWTGRRPALTG